MKYKRLLLILILVIVNAIVSCSSQEQQLEQGEGYPIADVTTTDSDLYNTDSGYPIEYQSSEQDQDFFYVSEITIPSPQEDLAVVYGTLLIVDDDLPYLAPSLYLGQILKPDDDPESTLILSSVSIEEDPIAKQSVDGVFVFVDVPPGQYGLFIWTPMSLFLIEDVETDQPIIFEVESGESLDLGTIYVP